MSADKAVWPLSRPEANLEFVVSFTTGTSRHDARRYTKTILAVDLVSAARRATLTIGDRPNTTITGIALKEPVFA